MTVFPALLSGRYRVLATVGRGGMGEVLKVEDLLHEGRILALKRFRLEAAPDALSFFRREFLTLAQLRHPNIATVYDFGMLEAGEAFFTAEFVDGIDLFEATAKASWDEIYDLLVQVCRGLAYVHSRGIIHRDVKPSNVLVTRERIVKIIDFGLALPLAPDRGAGQSGGAGHGPGRDAVDETPIRGTVHYLAPEVIRGDPIDRRADLYSLGVTAFEVATRTRPFAGGSSRDVIRRHVTEAPPRPRSVRPDVPEALDRVIMRLLEKTPGARFASADQVIRSLGRLSGRVFAVETKETKESWVLSGRFVGREAELSRLRAWFERSFGGTEAVPPLFVVEGEAGIGKTRLMREFRHYVQAGASGAPAETLEVQCDPAARAYGPFAELVRRLLRLAGDAAEALLGLSAPLVRRFAGEEVGGAAAVPATARPGGGDEDARRERLRLFDAVATFLVAATWRRPAVVMIHDLHRADEGTVALLAHLARVLGGARRNGEERPRIAFAATVRVSDEGGLGPALAVALPSLEEEGLLERVRLEPLEAGAISEIASTMLGVRRPPPDLERFLASQTGGNPFFLEELMKSLLERGLVQTEGGELRLGALESYRAPASITDAFRDRLARLDAGETAVLEALAVARRPASVGLVASALELASSSPPSLPRPGGRERAPDRAAGPRLSGSDLERRLDALERRGILRREPPPDVPPGALPPPPRFVFAHDLFRETVYAAIPGERRRRLHEAAGHAIERGVDRADFALLAEHFAEAGIPERAFSYALLAAREAASLFANERAIAHYERALALREKAQALGPEIVEALEALGQVSERVGAHERAAACYREILARPDAAAILGPGGLARVHRRLGETCEVRGEYDRAIDAFATGVRLLGGADRLASSEGAKLFGALAAVYVKLGCYDDAIEFCRSGLALTRDEATPEAAALFNAIGIALSGKADYEAAARHFEKSLEIRERLGEREGVAKTLNNLGAVYVERGQVGRAIAFFEQALERSEGTGDPRGTASTAANLGNAYRALGDDERAQIHYRRALEMAERLGDPEGVAGVLLRLAALECDLGEYDTACARFERAQRVVRRLRETREAVATAILGGRLLAVIGANEEAREAIDQALRLSERFEGKRDEAEALHILGRIERAAGDDEAAERAFNRSLTIYRKLGNEVEGALVTVDVLDLLTERGDLELARMIREKLEQAARALHAGRLLPHLELAAGRLEAASGAFGEAAKRLERARELAREGRRPELLWRAEHALGRVCEAAGAYDKALSCYVRAMERVRELFLRVPLKYGKSYLDDPRRQALRVDFQNLRAKQDKSD